MKKAKAQSSLSRDFTLYSAVILVALLLASVLVVFDIYNNFSDKIFKKLQYEATRIDRELIVEIEHSSYLLESLGRQISNHGQMDNQTIAQLLKSFDVDAIVNNVFSWIDDQQLSVASSNKGVLHPPVDVSDRDFVKKSITEPWKIQIGRPIKGRVSEKWVIPVSMGITDTAGKFLGIILISIDIDMLASEFSTIVRKPGVSYGILSENMVPLTVPTNDNITIAGDYPKETLENYFVKQKSTKGVLSRPALLDANNKFWYFEKSSRYPYIIVLGYDTSLGEESIENDLRPRIGPIFILAVFMIWILWLMRRTIIHPVVDLTEVAARIARGQQYIPLKNPGPVEIEHLSLQIKKIGEYINERLRIEEELFSKTQNMKRVKDNAELSNRIKAEFVSCMGHELKTPLNTIIGFSEVMKNQMFGPIENSRYQQYCSDIYQTGTQMLEMVNDMLAVSKIEAGITSLQEKPVDVGHVIQKCVRLLADKIQHQQVTVNTDIQEHLPKLMVDELRMKQIVLNLLSNAVKFSPLGGEITIGARIETDEQNNTYFSMVFTDHGRGMTPKELASVLSDQKADESKAGKQEFSGSTGIGIPLAKTLLGLHQGTIKIQSTIGIGTIVSITFPKERIVFWN